MLEIPQARPSQGNKERDNRVTEKLKMRTRQKRNEEEAQRKVLDFRKQ